VRHVISCLLIVLAMLVQPFALAATQLTDNPLNQADLPDYRVGTTGYLHLVWHDAVVDNGAILFKLFNSAGTELITDIQINDSSGSANTHPVTAIDASNRLFVVWQDQADQEVWFMRLEPLLDDLDPATPAVLTTIKQTLANNLDEVRISNPADGRPALNPAMAIDGSGNLHVVWESGAGGPVQYVQVDPDGNLMPGGPVSVSQAAGTGNDLPDIAIDSAGHVHVVYTQPGILTPADEIYYTMFDIDAVTGAVTVLIAPTRLTADDGLPAGNATVSVDLADDRVYVVYKQATTLVGNGDEQVYLTALDPSLHNQPGLGADLAVIRLHETAITATPAQNSWRVFSRIGSDRRVHAIYMDFDNTNCQIQAAPDYTIFNAHVTYDGKLITTETLTDTGAALTCNPQARLAPRSNRVVWTDNTTGNPEIFSALFSRADSGSRGFTCSLRNPDAGVAQAGELWLLLAFMLLLWRLRTRRLR